MPEARHVVLAVGVDERRHVGKPLVGLMVIDHHNVDTQRPGDAQRRGAGGAAVDGDDQSGAVLDERRDGIGVGTIALRHAVRDVDARTEPVRGKKALQQRRRAGAVDVVVAEHGDRLAAHDGIGEPGRGLVHVPQRAGVGHQGLDGRIEGDGHVLQADRARGQHAAQELGQAVTLADGDSRIGRGRIEPLAPGEPARRGRDAQIGAAGIIVRPEFADCPHAPLPIGPAATLRRAARAGTSIRAAIPQVGWPRACPLSPFALLQRERGSRGRSAGPEPSDVKCPASPWCRSCGSWS